MKYLTNFERWEIEAFASAQIEKINAARYKKELALQLQLIDPVCFGPFTSDGLNPLVEQVVVFPYPGKLPARVAARFRYPEGFEI